jgi:hypothetical protein
MPVGARSMLSDRFGLVATCGGTVVADAAAAQRYL